MPLYYLYHHATDFQTSTILVYLILNGKGASSGCGPHGFNPVSFLFSIQYSYLLNLFCAVFLFVYVLWLSGDTISNLFIVVGHMACLFAIVACTNIHHVVYYTNIPYRVAIGDCTHARSATASFMETLS